MGGVFYPSQLCAEVTCGGEPEVGACCLSGDECLGEVSEDVCVEAEGVWTVGAFCDEVQCGAVGGCCWGPFCLEASLWECGSWLDSTWLGVGSVCLPDGCSDAAGACCIAGQCLLTYEADCLALGGDYHSNGIPCEMIECYMDNLPGPCCLEDGVCEQLSSEACDTAEGFFYGVGLTCDAAACYACTTDIDESGDTGVDDLLLLVSQWNTANPQSDVNGDGVVNVDDLLELMSAWGACLPQLYDAGIVEDLEAVLTVVGQQERTMPMTAVLKWRTPLPVPSGGPIPIEIVELQLVGIDPILGEVSVVVDPQASGTLDLELGTLYGTGEADFSCSLLNELVPPTRPYAAADYCDATVQRYTFSLNATVASGSDESVVIQNGDISLIAQTPPEALPVQLASMQIPLAALTVMRKQWTLDCLDVHGRKMDTLRCNRKVLCIQPVFITYTSDTGQLAETGATHASMKARADAIWDKACIELEWRDPVPILWTNWDGIVPLRGGRNPIGPAAKQVYDLLNVPDCIEVFYVQGFLPPRGARPIGLVDVRGSSTAGVLIDESSCQAAEVDNVVAHEIGHILNLRNHPRRNTNRLMEESANNNNDLLSEHEMRYLRNPLLRDKQPKDSTTECCRQPG